MNIWMTQKRLLFRLGVVLLLISGLFAVTYMRWHYDYLIDAVGFPENDDIAVGIVLLTVVIIGTWTAWGNS